MNSLIDTLTELKPFSDIDELPSLDGFEQGIKELGLDDLDEQDLEYILDEYELLLYFNEKFVVSEERSPSLQRHLQMLTDGQAEYVEHWVRVTV